MRRWGGPFPGGGTLPASCQPAKRRPSGGVRALPPCSPQKSPPPILWAGGSLFFR
ncbi:hypothetical protein HMPREF0262_01886 [Clostridium sp. ATCC 29733]|nr:hypothetical protein HMPREF0262_01886 [Clostridium sp. ATCC 29733]